MKYIVSRGDSLHYQRTFPRRLQPITGRAMYHRIGLPPGASKSDIAAIRDSLNQQFEQLVAAAESSLGSDSPSLDSRSAMLQIMQHSSLDQQLTLNDLWHEYCQHKNLKDRARQIVNIDWQRFIRLAGNLIANDDTDTNRRLNAALQAQFHTRQQFVKASTAKRELSQVIAALKNGAKRHQLYWRIDPIKAPITPSNPRQIISHKVVVQLLSRAGDDTSNTDVDALLLLALFTGTTPAEVARLRRNDIHFDHPLPHLELRNSKRHIVRCAPAPIVSNKLRHSIDAAINLAQMSKGYVSRMCRKRLQDINGGESPISLSDTLHTYKQLTAGIDLNDDLQHTFPQVAHRMSEFIR